MQVINCLNTSLLQLQTVIEALSNEQYSKPLGVLSNSSIGQHVRHIIDSLQCMNEGYDSGKINYENRKRDRQIETNIVTAVEYIIEIRKKLEKGNKEIALDVSYATGSKITIPTNYYRELAYNLEHIIHHMAIIRIAITETTTLELAEEFGIAPATLEYRRACAQSLSSH
jgi:hypothetical protein